MTGLIIVLFLLLLPATGFVLYYRMQPARPVAVAPARKVAARPLSRRSHRISLARQRRRYQARIAQIERQQLALLYLLYIQAKELEYERDPLAPTRGVTYA